MSGYSLVTEDDFSVDEVCRDIRNEATGAIVTFTGVVRGDSEGRRVTRLEFETYKEMAEKELDSLREKAIEDFDLEALTVIHRYGNLEVGENIVLIAAASGHREGSFKAARFMIGEIKKMVPIWKKEIFEEGERWITGH